MERLTGEQLEGAVSELQAIPFFPLAPAAQLAIATQIGRFVDDAEHLRWLIDAALNTMRKWEGIPELRGLYCTKFAPKDGVEAWCNLPGYTPAECEARESYKIAKGNKQLQSPNHEFDELVKSVALTKRLQ